MNKPIRFFGLSSVQFLSFMIVNAFIIIFCVFRSTHPLIIIGTTGGIITFSGFFFRNLAREHKKGNPNYVAGLSVASATPKKIVDKTHIFNFLLKNK